MVYLRYTLQGKDQYLILFSVMSAFFFIPFSYTWNYARKITFLISETTFFFSCAPDGPILHFSFPSWILPTDHAAPSLDPSAETAVSLLFFLKTTQWPHFQVGRYCVVRKKHRCKEVEQSTRRFFMLLFFQLPLHSVVSQAQQKRRLHRRRCWFRLFTSCYP